VVTHAHFSIVTVSNTTIPSVGIPIARPDEQKVTRRIKAQFVTLTVVDARGTRRNQARNILRNGVIFDSSVLLQFKGTLYKSIAGQQNNVVNREVHDDILFFSLTDQRCNHFWR
jgi:hypothetical protein